MTPSVAASPHRGRRLSVLACLAALGLTLWASPVAPTPLPTGAGKAGHAHAPLSLAFSTYLGGSRFEHIRDVTTDNEGNIYVTGGTESPNYPVTEGAYQSLHNPGEPDNPSINRFDVFVTKLDPGGRLVWSTFLGGPNYDRAYAIEVDSGGCIYVAGRAGRGFPVTGDAFQRAFQGGQEAAFYGPQDGFVAKLAPDGRALLWASYFGTPDPSIIRDLDVDAHGDIYIASSRASGAYPPAVAAAFERGLQPAPRGGRDGVVAKIASDGSQVLWASYLGGSGNEGGAPSIRAGADGSPYALVSTSSRDMPTAEGAYDPTFNGGANDVFLAKLAPDGSGLIFGTYLGGSGNEGLETHNLALDAQGNAYITSGTSSADFPTTAGAFQRAYGGGPGDVYVSRISGDGSALLASTFVGGRANDFSEGISLDAEGNVYLSGGTTSENFPVTRGAFQMGRRGESDAFAVALAADLTRPLYSTYLGGASRDAARVSYADALGNFYVTAETSSTDWPARNALQETYGGGSADAALAKFTPSRNKGTGLTAQYFDGTDFESLVLTRTDGAIDFDWGAGSPDPALEADTFSARWSGRIEPRYGEEYTFLTTSDDGVRLWVNGELLIDDWGDHYPSEDRATITLAAGVTYEIRLEYYENRGGASIRLEWQSARQMRQVVPPSRLYPAGQ